MRRALERDRLTKRKSKPVSSTEAAAPPPISSFGDQSGTVIQTVGSCIGAGAAILFEGITLTHHCVTAWRWPMPQHQVLPGSATIRGVVGRTPDHLCNAKGAGLDPRLTAMSHTETNPFWPKLEQAMAGDPPVIVPRGRDPQEYFEQLGASIRAYAPEAKRVSAVVVEPGFKHRPLTQTRL